MSFLGKGAVSGGVVFISSWFVQIFGTCLWCLCDNTRFDLNNLKKTRNDNYTDENTNLIWVRTIHFSRGRVNGQKNMLWTLLVSLQGISLATMNQ